MKCLTAVHKLTKTFLQRDLAEMWRAHNHNAQVISTLTHSLSRMEEENARLRRHLADAAQRTDAKLDGVA